MKWFLRISLGLLLLLIVATSGIIWFLRSDSGLQWAGRLAMNHVPGLSVDGLQGSLPEELRVAKITLADEQGVWLEVTNAHVIWHPKTLLHKQYRVEALEVEQVHLLRRPLPGKETDQDEKPFVMPSIPDLAIERLMINEVLVEEAASGHRQRITLSGGGDGRAFDLAARTLEGPETRLDIHGQWLGGVQAAMQFEEASGGIVGALLKLPPENAMRLSLKVEEQNAVIQLREAHAETGSAQLAASGQYNPSSHAAAGEFSLAVGDMSGYSRAAGVALTGGLQAKGRLSGTAESPAVEMTLASDAISVQEAKLTQLELATQWQPNESGHDFHAQGGAAMNGKAVSVTVEGNKAGQAVTITALDASYDKFRVTGNAGVQLDDKHFSAKLTMPATQMGTAQLEGEAEAEGNFDAFAIKTKGHVTLPQGKADFNAGGEVKEAAFKGIVNGSFKREDSEFTLKTSVLASSEAVRLEDLELKGEGLSLSGRAAWLSTQEQAEAELQLAAEDLAPLGRLLAMPLAGAMQAKLVLTPGTHQQGALDASASGLVINSVRIDQMTVRAQGDENTLNASSEAKGMIGEKSFALALKADGKQDEKTRRIRLQKFIGQYDTLPFTLMQPAQLLLATDRTELMPVTLSLAGGTVALSGKMTGREVEARVTATKLELDKLPASTMPGQLDATLDLSGSPKQPKLVLAAQGMTRAADLPVQFAMNGVWEEGTLALGAKVNAAEAESILKVSLKGGLSLDPIEVGLNAQTPLTGELHLNAPINALEPYLRQKGLKADGLVAGNATISGSIGDPAIEGKFLLTDARLDHQDSGICLRNMQATLLASQEHITLQELTAVSKEGRLDAKADLALTNGRELNGDIRFSQLQLFCGGLAKGLIDGHLDASGSLDAAKLVGVLKLGPLNIQLPGQTLGQMTIPQVEVVQVDKDHPQGKSSSTAPLILDITLDAPERIFIRGRGLDGEFGGKLAITGPADAADFSGQFASRRGRFMLLDRELKLTEATLRFNGPIPPSPYLDVTAETKAEDTTIQAHLTGSAKQPEFSFTSTPSLPKDQILALLLFGRNISELTPFQAIQLAQSVAELSGKSRGPGVLGTVRNALGVDRLDVGADDNNSVTVGAGKYITDKVYIGVTQGAEPQDRAVTTEVEITPRISGTTSVDAVGQQSLGVQWKYDY